VAHFYFTLINLREKEKLLTKADSAYAAFVEKATLRLSLGETNLLEKITAQTQRNAIQMQLLQLQQEINFNLIQFRLILNAVDEPEPMPVSPKMDFNLQSNADGFNNHPLLSMAKHDSLIAANNVRLERSKLLPDFSLGYYNMSMRGTGSDNITYNASSRFHSAQLMVGVPLLMKSQQSKINASRIGRVKAENNLAIKKHRLSAEYQQALSLYQSLEKSVLYYENSGLNDAKLILEIANKQFSAGEINYLDWVNLANQSISIQAAYLDVLEQFNESIIALNFLSSRQ
jgi:cobalt-zinc-cadmium resistance protein CzcA